MMEISIEQYNKMAERLTELEYKLAEQPEIIHCRDCTYHSGSYCHYKYSYGAYVRDDHYCGYAGREEGDE